MGSGSIPFSPTPFARKDSKVLISGQSGLLNIFVEPQFAELSDEILYTVQASDFKTFQELELASYAEYRLEPQDSMFPFTGFAYAWNLEHLLSEEEISKIEVLKSNFNEEPLAFCWSATVKDYDDLVFDEVFEDSVGDVRIGYCLVDELTEELKDQSRFLHSFQVYPLYRIPTNHELKTIWVS